MNFFGTLAYTSKQEGIDSVYSDDVLVFSETLEDHMKQAVIKKLEQAGLKFKPSKFHFGVNLSHIITANGLKPNTNLVPAVKEFPALKKIEELRQFLGLSSYYR